MKSENKSAKKQHLFIFRQKENVLFPETSPQFLGWLVGTFVFLDNFFIYEKHKNH